MTAEFFLETERLTLRPHRPEDAPFMVELNSDPEVVRFTGDGAVTLAQAEEIVASLERQFREERIGRFIAIEKAGGRKIGWCGLKRLEGGQIDLGYRFLRDCWGRGYATETSEACLKYGFEDRGFERIIAQVDPNNAASIRVLKKLGMKQRKEGLFEIRKPY